MHHADARASASFRAALLPGLTTMTCKRVALDLAVLLTIGVAQGGGMLPRSHGLGLKVKMDSLARLPMNIRNYEMAQDPQLRGMVAQRYDSSGIREVGKWGRGDCQKVIGRDSLVFASLGSEVAIVNMAQPALPRVIYEVQAKSLVVKSLLKDSFLIIGCGGLEIWNIADPANPVFRNLIPLPVAVTDLCFADSLLLVVAGDSFRTFDISIVINPRQLGASGDNGISVTTHGGYAIVGTYGPDASLAIVDIHDPTHPQRATTWGTHILSQAVKDSFDYVTFYDPMNPGWLEFAVLDVADPLAIAQRGTIVGDGGYDLYPMDWFVYVSGYSLTEFPFQIIDVSDPDWPITVSRCTTAGWRDGVWADDPFGHAYIADWWEGIQVLNINDPVHPQRDTSILGADLADDIVIRNDLAIVADDRAGLHLLDISSPAMPSEVGVYDTVGANPEYGSVEATGTHAFTGWAPMRAVDISDSSHPRTAATSGPYYTPADLIIRNQNMFSSAGERFQVFDLSQLPSVRLVGDTPVPSDCREGQKMCIRDTFAYVADLTPGLVIVNIARPNRPFVVTNYPLPGYAWSVWVSDTVAYVVTVDSGLTIMNVRNPRAAFEIANIPSASWSMNSVTVHGTRLYVGGKPLRIYDVMDPAHPVEVGRYDLPDYACTVLWDSGYICCGCDYGGVAILEETPTEVKDEIDFQQPTAMPLVWPSPTAGLISVELDNKKGGDYELALHDPSGRRVKTSTLAAGLGKTTWDVDLSGLPDGIYFVSLRQGRTESVSKIIKRR